MIYVNVLLWYKIFRTPFYLWRLQKAIFTVTGYKYTKCQNQDEFVQEIYDLKIWSVSFCCIDNRELWWDKRCVCLCVCECMQVSVNDVSCLWMIQSKLEIWIRAQNNKKEKEKLAVTCQVE